MRNARDLMRCHIDALYTCDTSGDMVRVNESNGGPAPRFTLGVTADGAVRRFRRDVARDTRRELEAVVNRVRAHAPESPIDATPFLSILESVAPVERTWGGPAFAFPEVLPAARDTGAAADANPVLVTDANASLLHRHLPAWIPDVSTRQPMAVAVVDGHAVAVCCSVRRTSDAHEAGVETTPAWRRRGYAARAVLHWAHTVRALGVEPLYSTSWDNPASRAMASRLGLRCFGHVLHIS